MEIYLDLAAANKYHFSQSHSAYSYMHPTGAAASSTVSHVYFQCLRPLMPLYHNSQQLNRVQRHAPPPPPAPAVLFRKSGTISPGSVSVWSL
jgi:hypothetical protein